MSEARDETALRQKSSLVTNRCWQFGVVYAGAGMIALMAVMAETLK